MPFEEAPHEHEEVEEGPAPSSPNFTLVASAAKTTETISPNRDEAVAALTTALAAAAVAMPTPTGKAIEDKENDKAKTPARAARTPSGIPMRKGLSMSASRAPEA